MKKEEQKVLSNEEIYNLFGKRKINAKEFELDRVSQKYLEDFSSMLTEKES